MKSYHTNIYIIFSFVASAIAFSMCIIISRLIWSSYSQQLELLKFMTDTESQTYADYLYLCNLYLGYSIEITIATVLCGLILIGSIIAFFLHNSRFIKLREDLAEMKSDIEENKKLKQTKKKQQQIEALEKKLENLKNDGK